MRRKTASKASRGKCVALCLGLMETVDPIIHAVNNQRTASHNARGNTYDSFASRQTRPRSRPLRRTPTHERCNRDYGRVELSSRSACRSRTCLKDKLKHNYHSIQSDEKNLISIQPLLHMNHLKYFRTNFSKLNWTENFRAVIYLNTHARTHTKTH